MKYSVLNKPLGECAFEIKKNKLLCILMIVLALALNIAFTLSTTDSTLNLFKILNIAVDIAVGITVYTFYIVKIQPRVRLLRLCARERSVISGVVDEIDTKIQTHLSVDCISVRIGERVLFLPVDSIELSVGESISAYYTSNVIVEVEK